MGYDTLVPRVVAPSPVVNASVIMARALANRPAILLLDEATSALDVW